MRPTGVTPGGLSTHAPYCLITSDRGSLSSVCRRYWQKNAAEPALSQPSPAAGVRTTRTGAATLVTSGADVLEMVGAAGEHLVEEPRARTRPRDRLSWRDQQVLDAVPIHSGARADSIARTAGLGPLEVRSALTRLQRAGLVESGDVRHQRSKRDAGRRCPARKGVTDQCTYGDGCPNL